MQPPVPHGTRVRSDQEWYALTLSGTLGSQTKALLLRTGSAITVFRRGTRAAAVKGGWRQAKLGAVKTDAAWTLWASHGATGSVEAQAAQRELFRRIHLSADGVTPIDLSCPSAREAALGQCGQVYSYGGTVVAGDGSLKKNGSIWAAIVSLNARVAAHGVAVFGPAASIRPELTAQGAARGLYPRARKAEWSLSHDHTACCFRLGYAGGRHMWACHSGPSSPTQTCPQVPGPPRHPLPARNPAGHRPGCRPLLLLQRQLAVRHRHPGHLRLGLRCHSHVQHLMRSRINRNPGVSLPSTATACCPAPRASLRHVPRRRFFGRSRLLGLRLRGRPLRPRAAAASINARRHARRCGSPRQQAPAPLDRRPRCPTGSVFLAAEMRVKRAVDGPAPRLRPALSASADALQLCDAALRPVASESRQEQLAT